MKKRNQFSELTKIISRVDALVSILFATGVVAIIALFIYVLMTEVYQQTP